MNSVAKPTALSPRQGPTEIRIAAVQWARSRRGRVLVAAVVLLVVFLGLEGARHSETLSSSYYALSSSYKFSWKAHAPVSTASPLRPSNTTFELENGDIKEVPAHLTKANPNFHLLMTAADEDDEFCRTTLSAMLLNYPPPTIINLDMEVDDTAEFEKERLKAILRYLSDKKKVKRDDLVLIVDGRDTWFQLPSEVFIQQYQSVLEDTNKWTARIYGSDVSQSVLFGALKTCDSEDLACKQFPPSPLPNNAHGKETGTDVEKTAARYLDSDTLMGAAKDLKKLYKAAVKVFEDKKSQHMTVQSVMTTIFANQQMSRDAKRRGVKAVASKWIDYFHRAAGDEKHSNSNLLSSEPDQFEFNLGIDYTHTLFQPLKHCAAGELVPLIHDNSTDLSTFHQDISTSNIPLTLPAALHRARPPFWIPDFSAHNPSPNEKPAYIDKLEIHGDLDRLKPRDTTWAQIKLIQNTRTGAIPAIFHVNNRPASKIFLSKRRPHTRPPSTITWKSLWYSTYERALLRKYFRNPQSPIGYHTAATGGDRMWDLRGGWGGVWTEKEALWLPWGEVDGVCGSVEQMRSVFGDGKGVWMHELEEGKGETQRQADEFNLAQSILEKEQAALRKEEERKKEEEERKEKERLEAEEKEKKVLDDERLREEEERKKEEDDKAKAEEQESERLEQETNQKAYEKELNEHIDTELGEAEGKEQGGEHVEHQTE